jgi:hypothetical protein
MAEYIECRNCDSPNCEGCNILALAKMLHDGKFDCLMDANHSVDRFADVEPVRHGRWEIIKSNGLSELCRCSACGENDRHACYTTLPYCCHCGAKMAEEKIDLEDTE